MIPTFLVNKFGPAGAKLAFFGGIAVLIALGVLLAYCSGRSDGKTGEVVKQQGRTIDTLQDLGNANGDAANQRIDDMLNASAQAEELKNATQADDSADRQRIRRGCVILRQQGRNTADIPACR